MPKRRNEFPKVLQYQRDWAYVRENLDTCQEGSFLKQTSVRPVKPEG